jgi:hypothetical protein
MEKRPEVRALEVLIRLGSVFFHQLGFGFYHQFGHLGANLFRSGLVTQIAGNLANHVFMSGFFEIGFDHLFCIGGSVVTGFSHQSGSPETQQLVAAGFGLELHFRVMRVFVLKGVFAVVKGRHGDGLLRKCLC